MLDRPEIPLHTNGYENDIRAQVTRRKVERRRGSTTGPGYQGVFLSLDENLPEARSVVPGTTSALGSPSQTSPPFHTCPDLVRTRFRPPDRLGFCQHCRYTLAINRKMDTDRFFELHVAVRDRCGQLRAGRLSGYQIIDRTPKSRPWWSPMTGRFRP